MTNKILDLLNKVFTFLASVSTSITGLADFPPFPFAALALAPLTGTWVYIKMTQRLITQKKIFCTFSYSRHNCFDQYFHNIGDNFCSCL